MDANKVCQSPHHLHGFFDALYRVHREAFKRFVAFFGHVGFGHQGGFETQFRGFFQSLLTARRGPHLAGQTDFAKGNKAFGQGLAAQTAGDGQHHGQVGGGFANVHPPYRIHKHILVHARHTRMAVQHRQQHGQAVAFQAHTQAPWAGAAGVHQGLNFDQHGPCAF